MPDFLVTTHPINIHKRIDIKLRELILTSLVDLKNTQDGKKALEDLDLKPLLK